MRILGPSIVAAVGSTIALLCTAASVLFALMSDSSLPAAAFGAAALVFGFLTWRASRVSVDFASGEVVIKNIAKTHRVPLANASVSIKQRGMLYGVASEADQPPVSERDKAVSHREMYIIDSEKMGDPIHVDCASGLTPPVFRRACGRLVDAIEHEQGHSHEFRSRADCSR